MKSVNDFQILQNNSFYNFDLNIYNLQLLKQKYHWSQFISYLNTNSLLNKIDALRQNRKISHPKILRVDETKLNSNFPILNSKLMDAFVPLIGEVEMEAKGFL